MAPIESRPRPAPPDEVDLRTGMLGSCVEERRSCSEIELDHAVGRLRAVFDSMVSSSDDEPATRHDADGEVERMKSEFLSRIGHELRTPLTGITGYAELLTRGRVPRAQMQAWHEEILGLSRSMERIVQMLEFLAATGAGRAMLRLEPVAVRTLVDDAVRPWVDRAPGRVRRQVGRGLPQVSADPHWLEVSLSELIGNAVEFSPDGGAITVTAAAVSNGHGPGVEISVADHGQGMTATDIDRAFGDFVQGDGSDTRRHGGLGLGLSLVKRVVEGHGGTVAVASRVGGGSTFSILLPALSVM